MACKFHAAAQNRPPIPNRPVPRRYVRPVALLSLAMLALAGAPAFAEKADRVKDLNIEADLPGKIDLLNQFVVFHGNVVVTKGTMIIRAARIEVRETAEGYHTAVAFGTPAQHATFRQKRDAPDEFIEGDAERLEYDQKSDVIRFVNNATVRRLRGASQADEIAGNLVTYDSTTEVFNVSGGAPATAANPGGRVRATLVPKEGSEAAAEAAKAASTVLAGTPLKITPAIKEPTK